MSDMSFFVQGRINGEEPYLFVATGAEVVQRVDASDYTNEELCVFLAKSFGEVKRLRICGPWYYDRDPLRISICDGDEVIYTGYGTDH